MTITDNPSVRQVLAMVVADPQYPALARRPLWSGPHIGILLIAYGVFIGSSWSYLTGHIPLLLMMLLNQFAVYTSFTPASFHILPRCISLRSAVVLRA